MREIRPSGSEGGARFNPSLLPLSKHRATFRSAPVPGAATFVLPSATPETKTIERRSVPLLRCLWFRCRPAVCTLLRLIPPVRDTGRAP